MGFVLVDEVIDGSNDSQPECHACAPYCGSCNATGERKCDDGQCIARYGRSERDGCMPCSDHCLDCDDSGAGKCDDHNCEDGYGLEDGPHCQPCHVDQCKRCEEKPQRTFWGGKRYMCQECHEGYGLVADTECSACGSHCKHCDMNNAGSCAECSVGFVLLGGVCRPCADQCARCDTSGAGFCDESQCLDGWTTNWTWDAPSHVSGTNPAFGFTCRPCFQRHCRRCDRSGPQSCDEVDGLRDV